MSKKSWLGSSSDEPETPKEADQDAERKNPSTAGTQDPGMQSANQAGVEAEARPVNILRDDRSPETDDGSVNPHNEAAAQKPAAIPLDRATDEEAEKNRERIRNPKTGDDRMAALKDWGRQARSRGNIMSADWERFQELTGERTPQQSPEDLAKQQREREQQQQPSQQSATSSRRELSE